MTPHPVRLTIATRVYTQLRSTAASRAWRRPHIYLPRQFGERTLTWDTETRDEPAQRLLFGSWQLRDRGALLDGGIGLIMGDCCTKRERHTLARFAARNGLDLKTRDEFAEFFLAEVWQIGTTDITFQATFDHSRLASNWAPCRGRHKGAFSFGISRDTYKPRLRIRSLDSRKQFIELVSSVRGQSKNGWHKGYFVDVRTLVSALTDRSLSLEAACELYDTPTKKRPASRHGVINQKYIAYNLDDVQATYQVYLAAMRDFTELAL